jgi:hypothetical protein
MMCIALSSSSTLIFILCDDVIDVLLMSTRVSVLIVTLIVMLTSFPIMANEPFTFDFNNTTGIGLEFHSLLLLFQK